MRALIGTMLLAVSLPSAASTATDIAALEARINALRAQVEPLIAPLQIVGSDVRVFASLDPVVRAVADLNSLPATQRTVSLQSTGANGHFYDNNDLCNSFVELQGPGDLHASGQLTSFNGAAQDDGSLILTAHADTSGHLQAHWQFFGVRVRGPLGWNVCPPGGGVGGSIGAEFQKGLDFKIHIEFALAQDGQSVAYQASIIDPRRVDVTISLGLQYIGNIGIPTSFDVPGGAIASGRFPLLISNSGKLTLPGDQAPREYALALKPVSFVPSKMGIVAQWNAAVALPTTTHP